MVLAFLVEEEKSQRKPGRPKEATQVPPLSLLSRSGKRVVPPIWDEGPAFNSLRSTGQVS